jgi:hypothetical protein
MTRTETSLAISRLVLLIEQERKLGLHTFKPALDFFKRTDHEQAYLFSLNTPIHWVTNCDGKNKVSAHQIGRAADILLFTENGVLVDVWPKELSEHYHNLWVSWGGKPINPKEPGHFEG